MKVERKSFGAGSQLIMVTNDNGLIFEVSDLGARLVRILVPTQTGAHKNIVLGFSTAEEYLANDMYLGATIGRVAGRLGKGQFDDGNTLYQLDTNEGANTLHGGAESFETKIWDTVVIENGHETKVVFHYLSAAGENGFPGELSTMVTYTFTNDNEWIIDYHATTDKATLFNPTNHVYFNLTGDLSQNVGEHQLNIVADTFAVLDEESLPTGELRPVAGTGFDFSRGANHTLEQAFTSQDQQARLVNGIDHPFVLNYPNLNEEQVTVYSPASGIGLSMRTDAPAVVVYTANMGESTWEMFEQTVSEHGGFTLETQILPDTLNHADFGEIILQPSEVFTSTTVYKIKA